MSFIDKVRIFVRAGDGGNGCLSFRREKYIEFGGPDGGDGGRGGDLILEVSPHLTTLQDLSYRPHLRAQDGGHGKGNDKHGESGADLVVPVPMGTVVYKEAPATLRGFSGVKESLSNQEAPATQGGSRVSPTSGQGRPSRQSRRCFRGERSRFIMVADLAKPGERYLAARGGRGGRGNLSFKSHFNTAPRLCEKGAPGEKAVLDLELKLLADVGLVGFPNAGKSSLLARISRARPKVADYPFTTLRPFLGVASHKGAHFVVADIPGLIEGAHEGKGLGTDFLRHVERTRLLVHLIDPAGFGGVDPLAGVKIIEEELGSFSPGLAAKPRILAVNKMDLPGSEGVLKKTRGRYRGRVFPISAATGQGMAALLDRVIEELSRRMPREGLLIAPAGGRGGRVEVEPGFAVRALGGGVFELQGSFVERAAAQLDASLPEAVWRFQASLKRIGVDRALRRAGIREGDEVRCGGFSFDWSEQPLRPLPRLRRERRTRLGVGRGRR